MKNLEKSIDMAFEEITPDILDKILQDCDKQKGKVINMTTRSNTIRNITAIAASMAIVIGGVFGYNALMGAEQNPETSTIYLDVNPTIAVTVDDDDNVKDLKAENDDAQEILAELNYENEKFSTILLEIVENLIDDDYISEDKNSVLVSTDNQALLDQTVENLKTILSDKNIDASVMSLLFELDDDELELADELNVSLGKLEIAKELNKIYPEVSVEDFSKLTVNQLNLLLEDKDIDVQTEGKASEQQYIGESKARDIALAHANVTIPSSLDIDLEFENGVFVYSVEFETAEFEYDYDVNAITGGTVNSQKEVNDDGIDDDKDDLDDDKDDQDDDKDDLDDDKDDLDDDKDDLDDDKDDLDDDKDDLDDDKDDLDDDKDDLDDDNDDLDDDNDDLDDDNDDLDDDKDDLDDDND